MSWRATSFQLATGVLCHHLAMYVWVPCSRGRHHAVATECLDLVDLSRVGGAVERKWTSGTELRRALHQERLDAARPRSGSSTVVPFGATGSQYPGFAFGTHWDGPNLPSSCLASIMACAAAVPGDSHILERRVGYRVLRGLVLRRERREHGFPRGERDALGNGLDDVLQNQVRGCRDGRFIGCSVAEPSLQKVRPVVLRRDRVDRVVHGPLDHSHVDLSGRRCSACRPGKRGERADRNEVPLGHCGCVCRSGWCGRCADAAERPHERTDGHRDEQDGSSACHISPSP